MIRKAAIAIFLTVFAYTQAIAIPCAIACYSPMHQSMEKECEQCPTDQQGFETNSCHLSIEIITPITKAHTSTIFVYVNSSIASSPQFIGAATLIVAAPRFGNKIISPQPIFLKIQRFII